MTSYNANPTTPSSLPAAWPARLGRSTGVLGTVLATVLVWLIGRLAGADYLLDDPVQPVVIGAGSTAVVTLVVALLGWGALALLERAVPRYAARIWTGLAVAVLALSMVPIFFVEATPATMAALYAVHLAVAVLIPALLVPARRSAR